MIHQFFDTIPVKTPHKKIYSRLGYAQGITSLTEKQAQSVTEYIAEAAGLIELKGAACRVTIEKKEKDTVILTGGLEIKSVSIAKFLQSSDEVLFMGATAGKGITEKIREYSKSAPTAAVVFDATASEMADEALTWITAYYDYELRRGRQKLSSRRFSPGYGDFSLDNQKIMCETLQMSELDVTLNDYYILVPEKSVTAIAGIQAIRG